MRPDKTKRLLRADLISFRAVSYSAELHLAPSPNALRKTRRRGMKIGLPKIANSLCQNYVKKIKLVHHLLYTKEASKTSFVRLAQRKKIIQR
jgi:hypothetical protein